MSTISASTTTTTAYKVTADTTGALVFQTGATPTTAMTLNSDQTVTFAGGISALSTSGNLTFTGTGNRITGDFSNATATSRVAFQSSTSNGNTIVQSLPNGTGISSSYYLWNASDLNNSGVLIISNSSAVGVSFNSFKTGTGSYQPISISTGGSERINIGATGGIKWLQQNEGAFTAGKWSRDANWGTYYKAPASGSQADIVFVQSNGTVGWKVSDKGVGYPTGIGSGGTVTQATSKSTAVTLNKATGQITMNNASLAAGTTVLFTLTNSTLSAKDVLIVNVGSGGTSGAYWPYVANVAAGSAVIGVYNNTAGALGEAIVINYAIIHGA